MNKSLMKQISTILLCSAFVVTTGRAFSLFGIRENNPFAQCEELFKRSQYFEAISCYDRMFPAVSSCSEEMLLRAHLNYAEALLGVGDYVNGFRELDWRLAKRDPLQSPWNGSDPAGKTILVIAEQELGDTFFFLRYAQELKRLGAKVILLAQRPLKKILSHCSYLDQVVVRGESLPAFDYDIYLMSLPRYISQKGLVLTTLETISTPGIPYITPDSSLAASWRQNLSADKNFKIGICWRASKLPAGQVRYLDRDVPLSLLLKAINLKGVSIYSFQGPGHRPVRESEFKKLQTAGQLGELDILDVIPDNAPVIHGIQGNGWPFEDDAAAMKCMDLMICVDTSVPHLAAAMYCPVWILLPCEADWRWMTMINVSPWHPTALLLRQEQQGDWVPVVATIRKELPAKMAAKNPRKSCFDRFLRRR